MDPSSKFQVVREQHGREMIIHLRVEQAAIRGITNIHEAWQYTRAKWMDHILGLVQKANRASATGFTDGGHATCGFCSLFYWVNDYEVECENCPVYQHSGERYCAGTPFGNAVYLVHAYLVTGNVSKRDVERAVHKEIKYLHARYLDYCRQNGLTPLEE